MDTTDLTTYHYVMMALGLLTILFSAGWLSRSKSEIDVRDARLIVDPDGIGFGLSFEGRITNLGDKDEMLTSASCYLYIEKGLSIYSKFKVGIRGLNDDEGHLLPMPIKANESYEIKGFEIKHHKESTIHSFKSGNPVLRCKLSFKGFKPVVFRCNTEGGVYGGQAIRRLRETWKRIGMVPK